MKPKNLYLAITVEENGKYYAYMQRISDSENLVSVINGIKNAKHVNVWNKKKCEEAVSAWNETYKQNGTYMFNELKF